MNYLKVISGIFGLFLIINYPLLGAEIKPTNQVAKNIKQKNKYLDLYFDAGGSLPVSSYNPRLQEIYPICNLIKKNPNNSFLFSLKRDNHGVVVNPRANGEFELFCPHSLPEKLDNTDFYKKKNQVMRIGVFGIVENEKGEILVVKKKKKKFWYVPGGLAEEVDKDLVATAKREILKKTSVNLENLDGAPSHAYDLIVHKDNKLSYRKFLVFYKFKLSGEIPEVVPDDTEISESKWVKPVDFWLSYITNPNFSKPSIKYVLQKLVEPKLDNLKKWMGGYWKYYRCCRINLHGIYLPMDLFWLEKMKYHDNKPISISVLSGYNEEFKRLFERNSEYRKYLHIGGGDFDDNNLDWCFSFGKEMTVAQLRDYIKEIIGFDKLFQITGAYGKVLDLSRKIKEVFPNDYGQKLHVFKPRK